MIKGTISAVKVLIALGSISTGLVVLSVLIIDGINLSKRVRLYCVFDISTINRGQGVIDVVYRAISMNTVVTSTCHLNILCETHNTHSRETYRSRFE